MQNKKILLFNPVSIVHDRNVDIFRQFLPEYEVRCIYNPKDERFADKGNDPNVFYFNRNGTVNRKVFDNIDGIVLFSAQPRVPHADLITEAAFRGIPVIALQEVYQMMLEQGFVNEYFLPVNRLFVGSEYERKKFIEFGVSADAVEAAGSVFRYKKERTLNNVKKKLGLTEGKRYALLSLAYLTPSGETLDVRRQLISYVYSNLPYGYELIVKPHPAEEYREIEKFIHNIAPEAKVADKLTPIEDILQITAVLFNRGNSQVVIDALEKDVPVIVVSVGRKTFFDGLLDEVVVDEDNDIDSILELIDRRGMSLYKPIFDKYLSISPEDALNRVIPHIKGLIENKELSNPKERLLDLSVYWFWMGYKSRAKKVISRLKNELGYNGPVVPVIERLVSGKATIDDLLLLKEWGARGYRQWLLQSIWIKRLYLKREKLTLQESEWLKDFPPRMNREYFITYAAMLGWLYLNSGMSKELGELMDNIYAEYKFSGCIRALRKYDRQLKKGFLNKDYWRLYISCMIKNGLGIVW